MHSTPRTRQHKSPLRKKKIFFNDDLHRVKDKLLPNYPNELEIDSKVDLLRNEIEFKWQALKKEINFKVEQLNEEIDFKLRALKEEINSRVQN